MVSADFLKNFFKASIPAFQAPYAEVFDEKISYCYFPVFEILLIKKCQNKRV